MVDVKLARVSSDGTATELWNKCISQRQPGLLTEGIDEQPSLQQLVTLEALQRHAVLHQASRYV